MGTVADDDDPLDRRQALKPIYHLIHKVGKLGGRSALTHQCVIGVDDYEERSGLCRETCSHLVNIAHQGE